MSPAPRKTLILAAALVAVAWVVVGRGESSRPPRPAEPSFLPAVRPVAPIALSPTARSADGGRRVTPVAGPETSPDTGAVSVTALSSAGEPLAGERVRFVSTAVDWVPEPARAGVTDAAGHVLFEDLPPGAGLVTALSGPQISADVIPAATTALELVFPERVLVRGRVVDSAGNPVAGADVWMSEGDSHQHGSIIGSTAADGSFEARLYWFRRSFAAQGAGFAPSRRAYVDPRQAVHGECAIELVLDLPGAVVRGIVIGPGDRPIPRCAVLVGEEHAARENDETGRSFWRHRARLVLTDAAGRFRAEGVPAGLVRVRARRRGLAPWEGRVTATADEEVEVAIALGPGAAIEGLVTTADGQPVAGAAVSRGSHFSDFDWFMTHTRADGTFRLVDLPPGPQGLRAAVSDLGSCTAEVELVAGETLELALALDPGRVVEGTVVNAAGEPLEAWHVEARPAGQSGGWRSSVRSAAGRFRITSVPAGPLDLRVFAPDLKPGLPLFWLTGVDPAPGEPTNVVVNECAEGQIRGQLRDGGAGPVAGARVFLWHEELRSAVSVFSDELGAFESPALPRARYRVQVQRPGGAPVDVERVSLEVVARADLGVLVLPPEQ